MAWRIAKYISSGELDNRQKDLVTGQIWLSGKAAPIHLELRGNFLRDLAGCKITFENRDAIASDSINLDILQIGLTGDITASRKVNVVPQSEDQAVRAQKANALYIEWFCETNGRVVIEALDYKLAISSPVWTMSADEERIQMEANRESFRQWLEHLGEIEDMDEDHVLNQTNRPLNEFEWERLLKDSDRKNERLGEVLEKYHGHPDSEKLIAREMGWTWVEEELEAQERGVFADVDDNDEEDDVDDFDDIDSETDIFDPAERIPDPFTEGIDWVRDTDGSIEHPLALKILNYSSTLWKEFEEADILGDSGDSRVFEWIGLVESAGVRASNTLGDLAYGEEVEPGYIIAGLKRSVHLIHKAIEMLHQITPQNLMPAEKSKIALKALFNFREELISLMRQHRERQS